MASEQMTRALIAKSVFAEGLKKEKAKHKRQARYYQRVTAIKKAKCHACEQEMTVGELEVWGRRYESKRNICQPCLDKQIEENDYDGTQEPSYAGEEIFWRMNP